MPWFNSLLCKYIMVALNAFSSQLFLNVCLCVSVCTHMLHQGCAHTWISRWIYLCSHPEARGGHLLYCSNILLRQSLSLNLELGLRPVKFGHAWSHRHCEQPQPCLTFYMGAGIQTQTYLHSEWSYPLSCCSISLNCSLSKILSLILSFMWLLKSSCQI